MNIKEAMANIAGAIGAGYFFSKVAGGVTSRPITKAELDALKNTDATLMTFENKSMEGSRSRNDKSRDWEVYRNITGKTPISRKTDRIEKPSEVSTYMSIDYPSGRTLKHDNLFKGVKNVSGKGSIDLNKNIGKDTRAAWNTLKKKSSIIDLVKAARAFRTEESKKQYDESTDITPPAFEAASAAVSDGQKEMPGPTSDVRELMRTKGRQERAKRLIDQRKQRLVSHLSADVPGIKDHIQNISSSDMLSAWKEQPAGSLAKLQNTVKNQKMLKYFQERRERARQMLKKKKQIDASRKKREEAVRRYNLQFKPEPAPGTLMEILHSDKFQASPGRI